MDACHFVIELGLELRGYILTTETRKVRSCVSGNKLHYHECTADEVWICLVAVDFWHGDICLLVEDRERGDLVEESFLEFAGEFVQLDSGYPFHTIVEFENPG